MSTESPHILETIHQRTHVEHVVAVKGYTVHLSNGHAMIDNLAVMDYHCALCFHDAAHAGRAGTLTGREPCVHKAAVADALRLVKEEAR